MLVKQSSASDWYLYTIAAWMYRDILLKAEKLPASIKYLLNYGRQGNLMSYFFDYATLFISKIPLRNNIYIYTYIYI